MKWQALLVWVVLGSLLVCASGCFSARPEDIQAFKRPSQSELSTDKYILQPPDSVEVFCSEIPEINLQVQRIRPDGKISFEGVGEILAAGRTPSQLAGDIQQRVKGLYNLSGDQPVDVRVSVFLSKSYYVIGQVRAEGSKDYTGRDSTLDAIARAQPTNLAWLDQIQIVRPSSNPAVRPRVFRLDFRRMSKDGDTTKDVLLEEGDIIYVPPTVLAWIGLKVDELLGPIFRTAETANAVQPSRTNGQ
jgi:polysaccharide biosynthesis/export protein